MPRTILSLLLCVLCLPEFPSFYSLQQRKRRKHGTSIKVGTVSSGKLKEVLRFEELDKNIEQLQQEHTAFQHIFNETQMGNRRDQVFKFKLSKFDPNETNEKLNAVIVNLNCAAKVILALVFNLKNVDTDVYQYFYEHDNNRFFKKSPLLCPNGDLISLQNESKTWI